MNLSETIEPKSDQLNADDLIGGPITVTVQDVRPGPGRDQPVEIEVDKTRPYRPCKSMRRVLIACWGDQGKEWIGRSMTLFADPAVKFGGVAVGGIRISHLSHLDSPRSLLLTTTRAKRAEYRVQPLKQAQTESVAPKAAESTADATALITESGLDPSAVESEIKRRMGASAPESIDFSALSGKQYSFVQQVIRSMCERRELAAKALDQAKQWAMESYGLDFTNPDWAHIASVMTDVCESAKERGTAAAQAGDEDEHEKARQLYRRADLLLKEASAHLD